MNRIKQLREEIGITQVQLAEKLNKTQQQISLYEKGSNELDLDGYIILSKLFNCSIEYIAGKSNYRSGLDLGFSQKLYLEIQSHYKDEISKLKLSIREENLYNSIVSSFPIDMVKDHVDESEIIKYIKSKYLNNLEDISEERQEVILKRVLLFIAYTLDMKDYTDMAFKNNKQESNVFPLADEAVPIPVVGKISAGLPILATENIGRYEFAPSSMIKQGFTYFYLVVSGDSMNRKFNDGDIVLVQQQEDLENDEIGVFLIGDEATVKRYKREDDRIVLYPMSTNPEHDPQIYNPKEKSIKIIGKVISYQGKV